MKTFLLRTLLLVVFSTSTWALDFSVDAPVRLQGPVAAGVPVRNNKNDASYFRWPNGTEASVVQDDGTWVKIASAGKQVWVLEKYLVAVAEPTDESGTEIATLIIGAWNLEHFHDGEVRGFPEFIGSAALPPRSDQDYARIAEAIRTQLRASVMILSEIAGIPGTRESTELARLVAMIGPSWKYELGTSGGPKGVQRVALIYDENRVTKVRAWEMPVERKVVQGGDIFDRDPLVGFFRAKFGTANGTDFLVVALHLASGQQKNQNHNYAMNVVREQLKAALAQDADLRGEKDIVMGGDLNASRYDQSAENFWVNFDGPSTTNQNAMNYVTLAGPTAEEYKPTRVKANPPYPGSYIDYLIGSASFTNRLTLPAATVHHEFATGGDYYRYRVNYSDHFPITVTVKIGPDDDQ